MVRALFLAAIACATSACANVELDRQDFACSAGGLCEEDAGLSTRSDASQETHSDANVRRDASGGSEDDASGEADAGWGNDASVELDAGSGTCNAGPSGTWRRVTTSGATERSGHTTVVDAPRNRALIFGGDGINDSLTALALDGSFAFSAVTTSGSGPSGRREHSAVVDPLRGVMLIFGGADIIDNYFQDTFSFSLPTDRWEQVSIVPTSRASIAAAFGTEGALLFGGCTITGAADDTWVFDDFTESWHAFVRFESPPRRCEAAVTAIGGNILVHGGDQDSTVLGDTWILAGLNPEWTELAAGPSARKQHSASWDPAHQRALFFGGAGNDDVPLDDLWALRNDSPNSHCWSQLAPSGAEMPPARAQHTSFMHDGKLYLYGGTGANGDALDDLWELSF